MAKIGRPIKFVIRLTPEERTRLDGMIHCGKGSAVIPGVFNFLYINQSVKVNFIGYLIVDFLRWIFYAAAK